MSARPLLLEHAGARRVARTADGRARVLCYHPYPDDHVATPFDAHAVAKVAAGDLPSSSDNRPLGPGLLDQLSTGACWPHSAARCLVISANGAGRPLGFLPSTDALYKIVRRYAQMRHVDGTFDRLTDSGTYPQIGIRALNEVGTRPAKTADGTNDISEDPDVLNAEPSVVDAEEEAKIVPINDAAIADCSAGRSVDDVMADIIRAIAIARMGVQFGTWVDTAFMNRTASDPPMGACDLRDPRGGGHAITFTGHRRNLRGEWELFVDNSWGDWCDRGGVWVNRNFVAQISDIRAYSPERLSTS